MFLLPFFQYSTSKKKIKKLDVEHCIILSLICTTLIISNVIFQSDNGLEFVASVIRELVTQWPGTKIIRGRPRHPQSQGGVERGNQDLETKLGKLLKTYLNYLVLISLFTKRKMCLIVAIVY